MNITKRELEVLQLLTEGFTSKEIAFKLYLSSETIISHRENIKKKLDARNTAGLISKAFRQGIMAAVMILLLAGLNVTSLHAQIRNLHVEGADDQYAVIQTTSTGSSSSGIEFLRSSEFNGTDWRIRNNGGTFLFETASDNFFSPSSALWMAIRNSGQVNIYNNSNALSDNNETGALILGDPSSDHIALDNNGIIARNNNAGSQLLLQTGLGQGDTYINNLSGEVGIGTTTPQAKLGVEDSGFQMRLANGDDLTNEWYIGASRNGWSVGADKLVISPSSSSSSAMLVLDKEANTISARSNRVISIEDPVNDKDAVNFRTLKDYTHVTDISTIVSNSTSFRGCATSCRNLNFAGNDDWRVPALEEIAQFVEVFESDDQAWTSSFGGTSFPDGGDGIQITFSYYATISLDTGEIGTALATQNRECRCVR